MKKEKRNACKRRKAVLVRMFIIALLYIRFTKETNPDAHQQ